MASAAIKGLLEAVNKNAGVGSHAQGELGRQLEQSSTDWRKEYPDIKWKLDNVVEKGGRVGFQYSATGTHKKTGKKAAWSGSGVATLKGNKLVSVRVVEDVFKRWLDIDMLPPDPEDDISGTWDGSLWGVDFQLQADQDPPSDNITGTLSGLGQSLPVSGKNDTPNVSFSGNTPKGQVTFNGTWTGNNQISGTLNGAGFNNQPVVLNR
jgi:hypothetical protein